MVQCLRIHLPMQGTQVLSAQGTKIPWAVGQLSPLAVTTDPTCQNWRVHVMQTVEPTHSGVHTSQLERSLRARTERPCATAKDPTCLN